ncbi:MAG: nuclear transport factor 2 family protein [Bacteroidales bacterium]|nr:nuclear transport factor 2 family protein [Bacteroidales bacterium]
MSDLERQNKEIIQAVCKHLNDRNAEGVSAHIADEGHWTINGNPETFSFAGRYDKSAMSQLLSNFLGSFSDLEFNIVSLTAEDDRVIVEAYSKGLGKNSRSYENQYLMLYRMKDGKIIEAKEFFDPLAVLAYTSQN